MVVKKWKMGVAKGCGQAQLLRKDLLATPLSTAGVGHQKASGASMATKFGLFGLWSGGAHVMGLP